MNTDDGLMLGSDVNPILISKKVPTTLGFVVVQRQYDIMLVSCACRDVSLYANILEAFVLNEKTF